LRGLLIPTAGVDFLVAVLDGELAEPTVLFARHLLGPRPVLGNEHVLQMLRLHSGERGGGSEHEEEVRDVFGILSWCPKKS
jgi:hypothetical protein